MKNKDIKLEVSFAGAMKMQKRRQEEQTELN